MDFTLLILTVHAAATTPLGDTASWAIFAGIFTPLLVSFVQQPRWSPRIRTAAHVVVAVVIGLLTCLASGAFADGTQTVLANLATVLVASSASFKAIWQPIGVTTALEKASSPKQQSAPSGGIANGTLTTYVQSTDPRDDGKSVEPGDVWVVSPASGDQSGEWQERAWSGSEWLDRS